MKNLLYLLVALLLVHASNIVDARSHHHNHHHDRQKKDAIEGALEASKLNVYPEQKFPGELHRSQFPEGFVFGSAGSAYQLEGAAFEGGKGRSIWDDFVAQPGRVIDNSTGNVATDQYHRYKEDIWLMKDVGFDAYHLSISWPRIFPDGVGAVNKEGVQYYHKLLDALLEAGIEPYVTIYNWDMPSTLEESMDGWLNPKMVEVYGEFARFCFQEFGEKVKKWLTFNEIHSFVQLGYLTGGFAPGRCSPPYGNCSKGNSQIEPWIAAHNALNGHAHVVDIYRKEFQKQQNGTIGIKNDCMWYIPLTDSFEDQTAAQRGLEFYLGWFMDPIVFGDYPASMRQYLGYRLPQFTDEQKALIKGSYDWIGINHYSTQYAYHTNTSFDNDSGVGFTAERNGTVIAPVAASPWLWIYPSGFRHLLGWIRERYNNPPLYITENGVDEYNAAETLPLEQQLNDVTRINYYHDYLQNVLLAIKDGSDIRSYFAWSLLDNFEWATGYTVRFGLYYVDFKNNQARYPKASSYWFQGVLKKENNGSANAN